MDILKHWNITAKPFEETKDVNFFSSSGPHAEALSRLQLMAADGDFGIGVLTGETGIGKTFTASVFAETLDPTQYLTIFVSYARFGFDCILDQVNCALRNVKSKGSYGSTYSLLVDFRELLRNRLISSGRKLMLIIDDAQDLTQTDLDQIRSLSNESAGTHNAMTILMLGNENLSFNIRANRSVETRVGLRYNLHPLNVEDVATYVLTRINAVDGLASAMFTPQAIELLCEKSGGISRSIDRIAKLSLYSAAMRGSHTVERDDVGSVACDIVSQAA